MPHLINNIDRQNTHGIPSLECAGGSKLVEGTFGHPGEDPGHGVNTVLRVFFHYAGYLQPIGTELSTYENKLVVQNVQLHTQKNINEIDVAKNIEKVDDLCNKHLDGPYIVGVEIVNQVLSNNPLLACTF